MKIDHNDKNNKKKATLIGYARVSTKYQMESLDAQIEALKAAGCEKVYSEVISGAKAKRPEYDAMLQYLRAETDDGYDVLVVTRIDRLGRNSVQLINLLEDLHKKGIEFRALEQDIDTRTMAGKIFFFVMSLIAENEREESAREYFSGHPKGAG